MYSHPMRPRRKGDTPVLKRSRLIALALLIAWPLSACTSWQSLPAPETGLGRDSGSVRVLTAEGRELEVWYPRLRGDSLFGAAAPSRRDSTDIRLGHLATLKTRRFSIGRTVLSVVGVGTAGVVVGAFAYFAFVCSGGSCDNSHSAF